MTDKEKWATRFSTIGKAHNVLNHCIPKKSRNGWFAQKAISDNIPKEPESISVTLDKPDMPNFNWDSVQNSIQSAFLELLKYKNLLNNELSNIEAELCDCEHACEFFKLSAAKGYKLYAMIRERRVKRRYIKKRITQS